jgi:nucleotidyltransferase substrate binding protein (TIGR01987 family)
MSADVRWIQRLNNFEKAMKNLGEGVEEAADRELNKLEKQGVIQAFECCFELAWNTVKDFYDAQGDIGIQGSRDAFTLAFNRGLVGMYSTALVESIRSRQLTTHTYNEKNTEIIFTDIVNKYYPAFKELIDSLLHERERRNG